jgi:spatacsin
MQSRKKSGSPGYSDTGESGSETYCFQEDILIPAELFRILADCEKQKNPGESLLKKAKEMSWSILALIASCFPDVSPLSCLTVWLEITAARLSRSPNEIVLCRSIFLHLFKLLDAQELFWIHFMYLVSYLI